MLISRHAAFGKYLMNFQSILKCRLADWKQELSYWCVRQILYISSSHRQTSRKLKMSF